MIRNLVMLSLSVICLTSFALAQPATQPTTAPSLVAVDQSTPQGTLILLTRTMQNGDVEGAKSLVHASTPDETVLANLFVQAVEVNAKFRAAVTKAFGDGVADSFVGSANDVAEAEKSIRASKVNIENDVASVQAREGDEPVKLVRTGGVWKLSMAAVGANEMAQTQQDLRIRLNVLSGVADDVSQSKFKSPDEMGNAMRSRLATAVLQAAGSGPATAPAGVPAGGQ